MTQRNRDKSGVKWVKLETDILADWFIVREGVSVEEHHQVMGSLWTVSGPLAHTEHWNW